MGERVYTAEDIGEELRLIEERCVIEPSSWTQTLGTAAQIVDTGGAWGNGLAVLFLRQVRRESRRRLVPSNGNGHR